MQDNNLRIAFDYKYPDQPVLLVYETFRSSIFGVEDSVRVRKTIVGDKAVEIYSQLTGKSIPDIHMEIHMEAGSIERNDILQKRLEDYPWIKEVSDE